MAWPRGGRLPGPDRRDPALRQQQPVGRSPACAGVASRQRKYLAAGRCPRLRNGLGIAIISTSRGVLTDREARKLGVGGEVICEVW